VLHFSELTVARLSCLSGLSARDSLDFLAGA
jgi:hypothetical protein